MDETLCESDGDSLATGERGRRREVRLLASQAIDSEEVGGD